MLERNGSHLDATRIRHPNNVAAQLRPGDLSPSIQGFFLADEAAARRAVYCSGRLFGAKCSVGSGRVSPPLESDAQRYFGITENVSDIGRTLVDVRFGGCRLPKSVGTMVAILVVESENG